MSATHKTKGIVIRAIKYGETSLVVSMYTELFGLQTYMLNGVRTNSKKGMGKANLFQPACILDLVVYQNDLKNLQRISEFKWAYLYQQILFDVHKNAVALFMIELLQKCLKEPETNPELFYFIEDAFMHLDSASIAVTANFGLWFALNLAGFFGFKMEDGYNKTHAILDLQEGRFVPHIPQHAAYAEEQPSYLTSQLLKVMQPEELEQIKMNQEMRRKLLHIYEYFYALHIAEFGTLRTLPVLQTIF